MRIRFSGGVGYKTRPAVILSGAAYHASRADAVVVALTTKMQHAYFGDYDLIDWQHAGLPKPSRAKGVIQTIERVTIAGQYGSLSASDLDNLKECIRQILGL
ncbi:MAG: type II toxin-antitoxin system PemK/MazF family toxin [Dehalococcoidia bacterium]